MRLTAALLLSALALVGAPAAHAYNGPGHAMVGAVADRLLDAGAAQQVQLILGTDLRTAANWADCVKSVQPDSETKPTKFTYQGKDAYRTWCGAFETPDGIKRMEDYARRNWSKCSDYSPKNVCHKTYHYADVAIQHDRYDPSYKGTGDHDIVHAIDAAIGVLRGKPAPAPFSIADKREALLLLAHLLGDVHQPLHVGAIWLDADGHPVDPDAGGAGEVRDTMGGNSLATGFDRESLHGDWDEIPPSFDPAHPTPTLLAAARAVPAAEGDVLGWATAWATDTERAAQRAFADLSFTPAQEPGKFTVKATSRTAYRALTDASQTAQLAKGGARLAQLLNAVLTPPDTHPDGYLKTPYALDGWLSNAPPLPSETQAADVQTYLAWRRYAGTSRADEAARDDVYLAFDVAARFGRVAGRRFDPTTTPTLLKLLDRVTQDASAMVKPLKKSVAEGGRVRPLVSFPEEFHCPVTYAKLPETGSYPSTHAAIGTLYGELLAEMLPDKAGVLLARGIEFGDSRLVCGFHYPSDLAAGRLAANVLLVQLRKDATFQKDYAAAAKEVAKAPAL